MTRLFLANLGTARKPYGPRRVDETPPWCAFWHGIHRRFSHQNSPGYSALRRLLAS